MGSLLPSPSARETGDSIVSNYLCHAPASMQWVERLCVVKRFQEAERKDILLTGWEIHRRQVGRAGSNQSAQPVMAWGTRLSWGGAWGRESPSTSLTTTTLPTHTQPPSSETHFLCPLPRTQVLLRGASAVWKPHPTPPSGHSDRGEPGL